MTMTVSVRLLLTGTIVAIPYGESDVSFTSTAGGAARRSPWRVAASWPRRDRGADARITEHLAQVASCMGKANRRDLLVKYFDASLYFAVRHDRGIVCR